MKPAVLKILTFSLLFISAISCKKSDPAPAVTPKSKTTLITQTAWKLQTAALDPNKDNIADTDITALIPACKFDNTYAFKTDGTGTMDEATAKCNGTDPQTQAFTWVFKSTETILSGTFAFTNGDATIVSLTETTMVVAYDDASTSSHVLATLKH